MQFLPANLQLPLQGIPVGSQHAFHRENQLSTLPTNRPANRRGCHRHVHQCNRVANLQLSPACIRRVSPVDFRPLVLPDRLAKFHLGSQLANHLAPRLVFHLEYLQGCQVQIQLVSLVVNHLEYPAEYLAVHPRSCLVGSQLEHRPYNLVLNLVTSHLVSHRGNRRGILQRSRLKDPAGSQASRQQIFPLECRPGPHLCPLPVNLPNNRQVNRPVTLRPFLQVLRANCHPYNRLRDRHVVRRSHRREFPLVNPQRNQLGARQPYSRLYLPLLRATLLSCAILRLPYRRKVN